MFRINFILIIAGFLFISSADISAQDSLKAPSQRSNIIPALQSVIVPGWGQLSRGEWMRGGFFLLGGAFLAGDAYTYWEGQYGRPGWDDAGRVFSRDMAQGLVVWYGLGAVFSSMDALYAGKMNKDGSPTLAAFQSVLFPGWGQLANGKRWKAAGMFILQTGLAFAVFYQHENYLFYDSQGNDLKARFYKDDRNRLVWWSVGAVIFSAADAFVDCHLRNWTVSGDLAVTPVYFPENKTMGIGVRLPLFIP